MTILEKTELRRIVKEVKAFLKNSSGNEVPDSSRVIFTGRTINIDTSRNEMTFLIKADTDSDIRRLTITFAPHDHSHKSWRTLFSGNNDELIEQLENIDWAELEKTVDKMNLDCCVFYFP